MEGYIDFSRVVMGIILLVVSSWIIIYATFWQVRKGKTLSDMGLVQVATWTTAWIFGLSFYSFLLCAVIYLIGTGLGMPRL